jgi:transcriptional regulator with XRE-family HTH domain
MPGTPSSPTARRWELAARLRSLREAAGKSIEDAAKELMCSPAKISRMETAGRGILLRDIRDLCRYYGVPDSVREDLMTMATEARKPGWWADYRSIDEQTATFVGLESAADEILQVESRMVGGLLQSPETTRAILASVRVPGELTPAWIDDTVALRKRRQERLLAGELQFGIVMDEVVFLRLAQLLDAPALRAQLDHLLAVSNLPNATVQVARIDAGIYPGVDGSFQLLRFGLASETLPDMVHVEGLLGTFLIERNPEVVRYLEIYQHMVDVVAMSPDETRKWLDSLRTSVSRRRRR